MFCRKCGTEIEDGTIFCVNCGENIHRTTGADELISDNTVKVENYNDKAVHFINAIVDIFKDFFVKGPRQVIDEFVKRTGFEWSLLTIVSILTCGLGMTINCNQLLGDEISSYLSYAGLSFGTMFGLNVLTSLVAIFIPITIMWVLFNIVFKVNIGYTTVANIYSIAFFPVSIVYIVNMLVGCIYVPLALIFLLVVIIYAFTLLRYSIEKITPGKKADTIYLTTIFITILLTCITWFVSYKETISDIFSNIF